ncbi:MAG: hypothetical protein ABUL62_29585 [Myxococcales bacterium]
MERRRVGWLAAAWLALGCGGTALETGTPNAAAGSAAISAGASSGGASSAGPSSAGPSTGGDVATPLPPIVGSGGAASPEYDGNAGGSDSYGYPSAAGAGGAHYAGSGPVIGTGGTTDGLCKTEPAPPLAAWQPRPSNDAQSVEQTLTESRASFVGTWRGVAHTQFVPSYPVLFTFSADGGYGGHCTSHSDYEPTDFDCCRALYYGTDKDSSLKQWSLTTVNADHSVNGDLDIIYGYEGSGFGESGYQGRIANLAFDATGNRARFDFVYGTLAWGSFELERAP